MKEGDFGFGPFREGGLDFRGEQSAPDNDEIVFHLDDFVEGEEFAKAAEIENVADVCGGDRRAARARPGGEAGLAKFNGEAIAEDGDVPFVIKLGDESAEAEIDVVLAKPRFIVNAKLLGCGRRFAEEGADEFRTVVGRNRVGTDEENGAFLVVFPDSLANTHPADARTDDKVVATNHLPW